MAENQAKISLIFEIKQLDEERDCWCYCKQCDKSNLKKAIVIKDCKIDRKGNSPYSNYAHINLLAKFKVFNDLKNKNVNFIHKLNYFCSKGCAKLYFEIESKTTVDKWLKY